MLVNPETGAFEPFITGRTTAMDVAFRDHSPRPQFFVLEFSTNLAAAEPPPGRLLQYDTEVGTPIQTRLVTPVGMALDAQSGEIYISELATGRILKFLVP